MTDLDASLQPTCSMVLSVSYQQQPAGQLVSGVTPGIGAVCYRALLCAVVKIQALSKPSFFAISRGGGYALVQNFACRQYFGKGVHKPKNGKKLLIHGLYQAQHFSKFGGPISGEGGDIRMLSPPSDRGRCKLKIRSDANFLWALYSSEQQ